MGGGLQLQPAIGHLHGLAGKNLQSPEHRRAIEPNAARAGHGQILDEHFPATHLQPRVLGGSGFDRDGATRRGADGMRALANEVFGYNHAIGSSDEHFDLVGSHGE